MKRWVVSTIVTCLLLGVSVAALSDHALWVTSSTSIQSIVLLPHSTKNILYTVNNRSQTQATFKKIHIVLNHVPPYLAVSIPSKTNFCKAPLKFGNTCRFAVQVRVHQKMIQHLKKSTKPITLQLTACVAKHQCYPPVFDMKRVSVLVTHQKLRSITVTPSNIQTVNLTKTQQLRAVGQYADGSVKHMTTLVHWHSSSPEVASVRRGKVKALDVGVSTITATDPVTQIKGSAVLKTTLLIGSHYRGGIVYCLASSKTPCPSGAKVGVVAIHNASINHSTLIQGVSAASACATPWHLPTIKELTIIQAHQAVLNQAGANFKKTKYYYWSKDKDSNNATKQMALLFYPMLYSTSIDVLHHAQVRCVAHFVAV